MSCFLIAKSSRHSFAILRLAISSCILELRSSKEGFFMEFFDAFVSLISLSSWNQLGSDNSTGEPPEGSPNTLTSSILNSFHMNDGCWRYILRWVISLITCLSFLLRENWLSEYLWLCASGISVSQGMFTRHNDSSEAGIFWGSLFRERIWMRWV